MTTGFIITRHVNSKISDLYWKECYRCIRKFYNYPIMIIDDYSNKEFLVEDIVLTNCTVIYSNKYKGAGELLPYYYLHLLESFDTAIILHDSVFIQSKISFELDEYESIRFLWTFLHNWNHSHYTEILKLLKCFPTYYNELYQLYHSAQEWFGCFGVMSVVRLQYLKDIQKKYKFFDILSYVSNRMDRCALERVFAIIAHHNKSVTKTFFGDIHQYITPNICFKDYLDGLPNDIVKIYTGR